MDKFHAAVLALASAELQPGDFRSELLGRAPPPAHPAGPGAG